jgi:cytochrome c5
MKKFVFAAAAGAALMISAQGAMAADGKTIFNTVCFACHATGAAGAPKAGDKAAWAPRIAQGMDVLKQHALHGFKGKKGVMPPKGGRADLPDADIEGAVEYIVSLAK